MRRKRVGSVVTIDVHHGVLENLKSLSKCGSDAHVLIPRSHTIR